MKKNVVLVLAAVAIVAVDIFATRTVQAQIYTFAVGTLAATFAYRYGRYSPWKNNVGGRALMYFSLALSAVGYQLFTAWTFGNYWGRPEARAVVFGILILVLLHLNWIMIKVQEFQRAREAAKTEGV